MNPRKWILILITSVLALVAKGTEDFRLPETVIPEHYYLQILTDLGNDFSFKGKVGIDFTVTSETNKIVLHTKNLKIYQNETKVVEIKDVIPNEPDYVVSRLKRHSIESSQPRKNEDRVLFNDKFENAIKKLKNKKSSDAEGSSSTTVTAPSELSSTSTEATSVHHELNEIKNTVTDATSFEESHKLESVSSTVVTTPSNLDKEISVSASTTESPIDAIQNFSLIETSTTKDTLEVSDKLGSSEESDTTKVSTISPSVSSSTSPVNDDTPAWFEETYKPQKFEYHAEKNFLTIVFNRTLIPKKKYRLHINYKGVLSDTLTGFHRVPYTKKGSRKATWLASTVFEPNEARSAFPCFDEPGYKAVFDITLGHEKNYTALSNMPLKSTSSIDGKPDWQWSTFQTTPRMSTYLVAFLISDLEYLTPRQNYSSSGPNVTYRFWARHDVLYKTRYAMRIAPEMKNYLENLLEVRDVLPKHDFVALPSFVSSALENWGLYSFAEKNLLYTAGLSSIFSKFEITQVLAHEIAHMWFGNMVTPKWWNQVWLSEGFANFFEVMVADHIQPQWDIKSISVIFPYLKVFTLDALHSSHPLVPEFKNPSDLNDIFDSISYQKGFFLVRMLNYTLGQESFLSGIRKYIKNNLLSNTDENDLWEVLNDYAHQEANLPSEYHLKEIMSNWTRKTGYPIVDVTRDYFNNTATVTQKRFVRFKGDYEFRDNLRDEEEEGTTWWIPLTYTTGSELNFRDTKPRVWLNPGDQNTTLYDMPSKNDFVLMNLDVAGLYRVNYDERNWGLIISYLLNENFAEISPINRVQIIDDLLDLARSGEISYERALDATSYLNREKHFLPWKAALSNFDFISRMFRSTDGNRTLKKFLRNLVAPRFEELGFESVKNESLSDSLNRKQIAKWACKTGLRQCTRKSISYFKKWMEEKKPDEHNPVPGALRSVIYCSAIENGGSKEWQFLWQRYLSHVVTEKSPILYGLGCSKNSRTLKKYLDWSVKETSGIRKQDTPIVFKAVARNDVGFNLAKNFLKEKLHDMRRYLGNNPFYIPQIIDIMAAKMNKQSDLEDLEEIEQESTLSYRSAPRSFKQAFERVRFNIDWVEKNAQVITDWLKKQKF